MLKWEKLDTGVYTSECRAFHVEALKQNFSGSDTVWNLCCIKKNPTVEKYTTECGVLGTFNTLKEAKALAELVREEVALAEYQIALAELIQQKITQAELAYQAG